MEISSQTEIIRRFWPEWEILYELGRGSFGAVYECRKSDGVTEDTLGGAGSVFSAAGMAEKRSAIKVISIPQHESQTAQLRAEGITAEEIGPYYKKIAEDCVREIKTMESLKSCPNVVYIEDFKVSKKTDGTGWVILIRMELLKSLPDYMDQHPMDEKDILRLGTDICSALCVCHEKNIIHRDIKPGNIMVNEYGVFKLADFGIARELDKSEMGMSKKGTFSYMAPETELYETYDHRVDLYSLGIVLYQLLNNNRAPFLDPYSTSVTFEQKHRASMRRLTGEAFPPPVNGSEATKRAVMKACAYAPENRYAGPEEMLRDLKRAQDLLAEQPVSRLQSAMEVPHVPTAPESAAAAVPQTQPLNASAPAQTEQPDINATMLSGGARASTSARPSARTPEDREKTMWAGGSAPQPPRAPQAVPFSAENLADNLVPPTNTQEQTEAKPVQPWVSWVVFALNILGAVLLFYIPSFIITGMSEVGDWIFGAGTLAAVAIAVGVVKLIKKSAKKKKAQENGTPVPQKTPAKKRSKRAKFALGAVLTAAILTVLALRGLYPSYFTPGRLPDVYVDTDRFAFTVDGDTVQLPIKETALKEKGWEIKSAPRHSFPIGGLYADTSLVSIKKDGLLLLAAKKTFNGEDYITGISVPPSHKLTASGKLHFTNGFVLEETTLREVYAVYSEHTRGGTNMSIEYSNDSKGMLLFCFDHIEEIFDASDEDLDRAVLSGVEMIAADPASAEHLFPTIDTVPEVYFDMDTFIMSLAGEEYQFPITVAEFESRGWTLQFYQWGEEIPDTIASGDDYYGTVEATHSSGVQLHISEIRNFSNSVQDLRSCHICSVTMRSDCNIISMNKLRLSHGLRLGETTQAELRAMFPNSNGSSWGGDELSVYYSNWDLAEVEFYFEGANDIDDTTNGILSGFAFRVFTEAVNSGEYAGRIMYYLTTPEEYEY